MKCLLPVGCALLFSVAVRGADMTSAILEHRAQNYESAFAQFLELAEAGDSAAQANVGLYYDMGLVVTEDPQEAVRWYRRSADQGDPDGQYNLAAMYELGRGVTQDYARAFDWYNKAANQGDLHAEINIGLFYEEGLGRPVDKVLAYAWYHAAAESGELTALEYRRALSLQLEPEELLEARRRGEEIRKQREPRPVLKQIPI